MGKLKITKRMSTGRNENSISVNQISESEAKWFAVYTKYKCEKYVADHLIKKQIVSYLPLIAKTKRYTRKVKHYEVPLINCYVFVCISKSQYVPTLETEYVMKFLRVGKDLLAIPEAEIDLMKRIVGDILVAKPIDKNSFVPGEDVEVISGHLTGVKGKIVSQTGKKSFLVELKSIGYQLMINIDLGLLKPVENKILVT